MRKTVFHIAVVASALFLSSNFTAAQEYIGLRIDNYAGSNGMLFNPALPGSGLLPWDVNILAYGHSFDNNFAYLPDQSVIGLGSANSFTPDFYNPGAVKAFGNVTVQEPSAFLRYGNFTFGFFTAARSAGSIITGDKEEGFRELTDIQQGQSYTVPTLHSGLLNWAEIGLNGELQVQDSKASTINLALNAKLLLGLDAYTGQINRPVEFVRHETFTEVSAFDYSYAYTTNLGSNRMTDISNYGINGYGTAIDIGMAYQVKSKLKRHKDTRYSLKVGVAVVDLGLIHFGKNAATYTLESGTAFTALNSDLDSISDLDEFTKIASRIIYDNGRESKTGSDFTVFTPAAITLFADNNIGNGFFVSAMMVQRLSMLSDNMIARANLLAITPRFEKEAFAVSLPLVLAEYADLHLGAALRLYFLTIGSDDILSLFTPGDLDGTDLYVSLRLYPFWRAGHFNGGGEFHISRRKQVECPAMQ